MPEFRSFSLGTAFAAAAADRLEQWVGDFLASRGSDNEILAAALAQEKHWWAGPLQVPIDDLEPLAGPDDDDLCPIEPDEWEGDVATMEESIDAGWQPPPLLAEAQDGRLLLQDGNHRFEALRRRGESHAWIVAWFADAEARDRFHGAHPECFVLPFPAPLP